MISRRSICSFIAIFLSLGFVCGCGNEVSQNIKKEQSAVKSKISMLEEPEFLYEKEEMLPSIMVDLSGYDAASEKIAIIEGSVIPKEFEVINNDTNKVVFRGITEIRREYDDEGLVSAKADFSRLEEGSYHIETELLGRSKDFVVKNNLYSYLLNEAFAELENLKCDDSTDERIPIEGDTKEIEISGGFATSKEGDKDVADGCLMIFDLLKAYEYFPKVYTDSFGIKDSNNKIPDILDEVIYEIKWLMKMQNMETGGVYTSVATPISEDGSVGKTVVVGETTRATSYFCATMAKASHTINKADARLASECMKRAELAWNCLEVNKELVAPGQMFRAAVEMYRCTGNEKYEAVINDYLRVNASKPLEDRLVTDAAMSYMSTSKTVNLNYCTVLMQTFMSDVEDIAGRSKAARYYVDEEAADESSLLRNLTMLVEADYIITSKEYENIEVNYLHYLSGRNPMSKKCDDLANNPDTYAQLIFALGKLAGNK